MSEMKQADPVEASVDPFFYGWRFVWKKDENGDMHQVQQPLTAEDVLHPEEDDFIMNHTGHDSDVDYLRDVLARISAASEKTRVLREVRIEWGVPGVKAHGPDVVFFTNVQEHEKRSLGTYRPKDVEASPLVVIEVTSPSTRSGDLNNKVSHYYQVGIPFYAIVDYLPETDLAHAVVLGYRASSQGYLRLPLDDQGRLWIEPLRFWLAWEQGRTVCYDEKNERILTDAELNTRLREVETRSEELSDLAEEAILARQEAERETANEARQRSDAERREADEARKRAAAEKREAAAKKREADEARRRAVAEKREAEAKKREADEARKRTEAENLAVDEARKRADAESRSADLAALVAQLQAQLRQAGGSV